MSLPETSEQKLSPLSLPDNIYGVFEEKGAQNAEKVRRILQITNDLCQNSFRGLRILDLGCAEGVYAIEAALRGAQVVGVDGRIERMQKGKQMAEQLRLQNVRFLNQDVRNLNWAELGHFHVIYCLGLLYHLDEDSLFPLISKLSPACTHMLVIDTHTSPKEEKSVAYQEHTYFGRLYREHQPEDSEETMHQRLGSSIKNRQSFWLTRKSLSSLLHNHGFTCVFECRIPPEYVSRKSRTTFVALKGQPITLFSYPWMNDLSEKEIKKKMIELGPWRNPWRLKAPPGKENPFFKKLGWWLNPFRRRR
ncbi:MAG: methyltransferase domain-containing protein [Candidatus Omnitrophica bacterium]|nr:methyltransferase domain-containing protein [Candidatus Omnitrophota bacterium]